MHEKKYENENGYGRRGMRNVRVAKCTRTIVSHNGAEDYRCAKRAKGEWTMSQNSTGRRAEGSGKNSPSKEHELSLQEHVRPHALSKADRGVRISKTGNSTNSRILTEIGNDVMRNKRDNF